MMKKTSKFSSALAMCAYACACACGKEAPKPEPARVQTGSPDFTINGTPSAPASVANAPNAPSAPNAPPPVPSASVSTTLAAGLVAPPPVIQKDAGKTLDAPKATTPASTQLTGKNFALAIASPGCRAGEECQVTIQVTAGNGYHVNKEYPYKFLANAAPGIEYLGKKTPTTFARESGDFREDGETKGTMTVRFKPAAAGTMIVSGTYKMSVCSAENCQIEAQPVTLSVPVI